MTDEEIIKRIEIVISFKKIQLSQMQFNMKKLKKEIKKLSETLNEFKKSGIIIL